MACRYRSAIEERRPLALALGVNFQFGVFQLWFGFWDLRKALRHMGYWPGVAACGATPNGHVVQLAIGMFVLFLVAFCQASAAFGGFSSSTLVS
jgi:hypothetical protein